MKEITVKQDSFVLGRKTQGVEMQDYNEMMATEKTGPLLYLFQKTEIRNSVIILLLLTIYSQNTLSSGDLCKTQKFSCSSANLCKKNQQAMSYCPFYYLSKVAEVSTAIHKAVGFTWNYALFLRVFT